MSEVNAISIKILYHTVEYIQCIYSGYLSWQLLASARCLTFRF